MDDEKNQIQSYRAFMSADQLKYKDKELKEWKKQRWQNMMDNYLNQPTESRADMSPLEKRAKDE